MRYGGTPDRIGILNIKKTLLEIKTSDKEYWHKLQVWGYIEACLNEDIERGMILYLKSNGKYELIHGSGNLEDREGFLKACWLTHYQNQFRKR